MAKDKISSFFVADIFSSSHILDPAEVKTAGQFIVLTHIIRPLTRLNSVGQIEGDIVKSWEIKDNSTYFIFSMKENLKWSDGTEITADDVVHSLGRQKNLNKANHFNFKNINKIEKINRYQFSITLSSANYAFIRQTTYPEFGILSKDDYSNNSNHLKLQKTSGPYSLAKINDDSFELIKNEYYESFSSGAPTKVRFQWTGIDTKIKGLKDGKIDFAIPFMGLNEHYYSEINSDKNLTIGHPHIGYTFWLTLNPKNINLKNIATRRWLQSILNSKNFNFKSVSYNWLPADQLYLPDGPGRPSQENIQFIWDKIKKVKRPTDFPKELSLLIDKNFPFTAQVISILEKNNIKVNTTYFETGEEFFKHIQKTDFDLIQARNDFSSVDLHENLQTTFNPHNPLIVTELSKAQYQHELSQALTMTDETKRHDKYKEIALDLLENAYIVPIAYNNILFFHKKNIDITSWSKLFPEISTWKIHINTNE